MGFFYLESFTSITGAHLRNPQEPLCKGTIKCPLCTSEIIHEQNMYKLTCLLCVASYVADTEDKRQK